MERRILILTAKATVIAFTVGHGALGPRRLSLVCSRPSLYVSVRYQYDQLPHHPPAHRTPLLVNAKVEIRRLDRNDESRWRELWHGYLRFYRHHLPEDITAMTFERLIDSASELHGLVAESGGTMVGFVNYLYHASSWSKSSVCYLEDLFVDPGSRGLGAGRALILAVYAAADADGAQSVYWMTQEFNAEGRALYDTLARRTSFIKYER